MRWITGVVLTLSISTAGLAQFAPIQIAPAQQLWTVDVVDEKAVNDVVVADPVDEQAYVPTSTDLSFSPSSKRTQANLAQFVAKVRAQSPAAGDDLERFITTQDVLGTTGGIMGSLGLDPHNVADAYALWWIIVWAAANNQESPSDAATYQAVQRQARTAFGATTDFGQTSDADRQQFAEALMVQAALLDTTSDSVQGDAASMKLVAAAARKGAESMGLNLDTMVLTSEGFRPRKGAELERGADGADVQLASSDVTVAGEEGMGLPVYLAIAAAAGAGLGAAYLLGKAANRKG